MSIVTEKKTIEAMMRIYCKDIHHTKKGLCLECEALRNYTFKRIDHCPIRDNKPACKDCKIHCYAQSQREMIKEVMKHSGKKMPLRHPYLSILHIIRNSKQNSTDKIIHSVK